MLFDGHPFKKAIFLMYHAYAREFVCSQLITRLSQCLTRSLCGQIQTDHVLD